MEDTKRHLAYRKDAFLCYCREGLKKGWSRDVENDRQGEKRERESALCISTIKISANQSEREREKEFIVASYKWRRGRTPNIQMTFLSVDPFGRKDFDESYAEEGGNAKKGDETF